MVFPRNRLRHLFCLIALSSLLLLTSPARGADPVDTDKDGMSNIYETDHGLNPADPSDKDDDPDADGSTNYDEFIAGTNPQDPDDFPAIPPLILELPATLYSDQISALVIKTSARTAGGSVFLSLYFDANDNGLIDVGEWPVFFEAVRDGYTGLTKTFARDSNPEASAIVTTIGGASESCFFSAFPVGSYILRAQYSGLPLYTDRVFSVEAVPTTATIAGRVEEEGAPGTGIANALVYFGAELTTGQFEIQGMAFTDATGNFSLKVVEELPLAGYLAAIRDSGDFLRNDSGVTFTLAPDSVTVPLLTLSRGDTSLTGAVTDYETLRPIFGLELNADSPPLRGKAFTGGEGNYRLPLASGRDWNIGWGGFVPGYFAFVEKRSGEYFLEYDLADPAVPGPEVMDLWGFPETAWANVQVVDEHGEVVENAQFTLIRHYSETDPVLFWLESPGITDANGLVRLGAREGDWELRPCYTCTTPLVDDQPVLLVPGTPEEPTLTRGTSLDLTSLAYRADGIIEGYVVYTDGLPAGGVVVDLWSGNVYNNNVRIAEWPNIQVETDENGFFRVPVLGGLWDVTAYNDWGYSATVTFPAPVDYDEIVEPGEVTRLKAPLFIPPDYCFDGKNNNGEVGDGGACDTAPAVAFFTLDVTLEGSGTGTVTDDRGALFCTGGTCSGSYPTGAVVTMTAVAGEGSTFSGWGGACTGSGACTVTVDQAKIVTAAFETHSDPVPPIAPMLSGPAGEVATTTPTYSWGEVAGATSYEHYTNIGGVETWVTYSSAVCAAGVCSVTSPELANGSSVYWVVRAKNAAGASAWSASKTFGVKVLPGIPILTAPAGEVATTTPTYNWGEVVGATSYEHYTNIGGVETRVTYSSAVCAAGVCSVTSPELANGSSVYWVVRAKNLVGSSPWSAPLTFKIR